jgi:hypothetical protein
MSNNNNTAKDKKGDLKDDDLSELDKIKKENEELRSANRLRDAKDAVIDALTKAQARSPLLLWKSVQSDLEFDDKGSLKNLDTLIKGLKTDFEDQFGQPKPEGSVDGGAGQGGSSRNTLTIEQIKHMKPSEINENWKEVQAVMDAQK